MPTIPETQFRRLLETRGVFEDFLDERLDDLSDEITALAKKAHAKVKKSNYRPSVVRAEARKLARKVNVLTNQTTAITVPQAAAMGAAAGSIVRAWDIADRTDTVYSTRHIVVKAETVVVPPVQSESALNNAGADPGRPPAPPKPPEHAPGVVPKVKPAQTPYPQTDGVTVLERDLANGSIKPNRGAKLSTRLHSANINNTQAVDKAMTKILREGKSMDEAGRILIREAKKQGAEIGRGELPQYLQKLKRAGRNLTKMGSDDPAALKEWNRAFESVKKHVSKLADSRGGGAELVQLLEKGRVDRLDKALDRWFDEKQRSNAERTVDFNTTSAYNDKELKQAKQSKRITFFISHLNRPARRQYVRRTKKRKKGKLKGRRCVCEGYDKKKFPLEVAQDYPGGFHNRCKCTREYIYNTGETVKVTGEDLAWFEGLPS